MGKISLSDAVPSDLEVRVTDIPKGDYLLALKWIDPFEAKDGTLYWRCRYQIVAGPHKDQYIWVHMSRDTSVEPIMRAWMAWAFAIGTPVKDFDTDSMPDVLALFKGRVFKAFVNRTESDDGTRIYYRISRRYFDLNKAEAMIKAEWERDYQEHMQQRKQSVPRDEAPSESDEFGEYTDSDAPF